MNRSLSAPNLRARPEARALAEHGAVLQALIDGDAGRAEALMRSHLEGARDALAHQFDTIAAERRA